MSEHISLLLAAAMFTLSSVELAASDHISATLTPSQGSYLTGEPIDLLLILSNESDAAISIEEPSVHRGIKLAPPNVHIARPQIRNPWIGPPLDPVSSLFRLAGWKTRLVSLAPGETRTLTLFLGQFINDPSPGSHEIAYSIDIAPLRQQETHVHGAGVLKVVVVPAGELALADALARRAKQYESSDSQASRTAEESLLLVRSPLVIPYLARIRPWENYEIVMAMEKFKGNREAEDFVIGKLRAGETAEIAAALYVLQEWQYVLPESEVARLLSTGKRESRLAAIRYVYRLPGRHYLPEVSALVGDSDASVAQAANRVVGAVIGEKQ